MPVVELTGIFAAQSQKETREKKEEKERKRMDDSGSQTVQLYIYDLTSGMAAMMSQMLAGRHIEGIWHTAVVIYGREYFYGGQGIQSCMPVSSRRRIIVVFVHGFFSFPESEFVFITLFLDSIPIKIVSVLSIFSPLKPRTSVF